MFNITQSRIFLGIIIIIIAATGILLRTLYIYELPKNPDFKSPLRDCAYHDYWAKHLVTGNWHSKGIDNPKIHVTPYFRPPGYPYFLAMIYKLFGFGPFQPRIFQMAIGMFNCLFAFLLGRKWFGAAVGFLLSAFMATSWIFIYFEGELLAPVVLVGLAILLIYALSFLINALTFFPALFSGILLGLFALFRPNILAFFIFALSWIIWLGLKRKNRKQLLLAVFGFIFGTIITIAPATIRNYLVANEFVLISSNAGINLYMSNNIISNGIDPAAPDIWSWSCFNYPAIVKNLEKEIGKPLSYSEASSCFTDRAITFIRENPKRTLELVLKKIALFWGPKEVANEKDIETSRRYSRILRILPFPFSLVLAVGLMGLAMSVIETIQRRKENRLTAFNKKQILLTVLIAMFILSYFASYLPFIVAARYRTPLIPFLLLFAAIAVVQMVKFITDKKMFMLVFWAAAGFCLYSAGNINIAEYKIRKHRWYDDRGLAYSNQGKLSKAIREYKRGLRIAPRDASMHKNFGNVLEKSKKVDEAIRHYNKALKINPVYADAYIGLGSAYKKQGKLRAAQKNLKTALTINPNNPLAKALMKKIKKKKKKEKKRKKKTGIFNKIRKDFKKSLQK